MNEHRPILKDFHYDFEKSEEILRKKLFRKVYFIVTSMIVVLTAIIIIEFKEYSFHTTTEYKIGKNDLGPRDLVWAGIMGSPPSYYESDKKYGLGIKEYETREIRVALEEAGFNLIYRYMSPNRLEFEFARKHPLCFYDRRWNNPKEYFKKSRPEILSIPLNYSGRDPKKIFFRKEDKAKFEKHLDEKGNLLLNSLFKDTSLKTELVRAVNYDGPYARENITYGKKQLDGTYYDMVKEKYAKNIDLVILHTNDQILQMLGKKRFDYQFFDTLEYDDYVWLEGGKNRIDTLIYDLKSIRDIEDPGFIFHSVACGDHALTKQAMPIINEVIFNTRNNKEKYDNKVIYTRKLSPFSTINNSFFMYSLASQISDSFKADVWYDFQFSHFNKPVWPKFNILDQSIEDKNENNLNLVLPKKLIPQWNLIEEIKKNGERTFVVIHDTDLKNKEEENYLTLEFLEKKKIKGVRKILDKKEKFKELNFANIGKIDNLVIFALGIKNSELQLLNHLFSASSLKGLTLIDGSLYHSKEIQKSLSSNLELLRFYNVPLIDTSIGSTLKKLKRLKSFALHSGNREGDRLLAKNKELLSIIQSLPAGLEELSLFQNISTIYDFPWFPEEFSEIFAKKKFHKLKYLQLKNFSLDEKSMKQILDSTPLELESLVIGTSLLIGSVSSFLIEDFLNKRYSMNKLKMLKISRMMFSLKKDNKILLPKSLEDLAITWTIGPIDSNFDRIIFHPDTRLRNLDLSQNNLSDYILLKVFPYLHPTMENLIFSKNKITGKLFINSNKRNYQFLERIKSINNLKLDSNPIDDQGFVYFSQLPWEVRNLDISNIRITDISFNIFSSKKLYGLKAIDLSDNYLTKKFINDFIKFHFTKLHSLKLRNVLSLDVNFLSQYIPTHLQHLDLAGNLLSDEQIVSLANKLPKNLQILNITGSRMSKKGAKELAKNMPNLTQFYFDFKAGQQDSALKYLLYNLSPFLTQLSPFWAPLSYHDVQIISKHMPAYLREFQFSDFEKEECNILFTSFPNTLKTLYIRNGIKTKGNSLKILKENLPEQLVTIQLGLYGENITALERDEFLLATYGKILDISLTTSKTQLSPIHAKYLSNYIFYKMGHIKSSVLKDVTFPPVLFFKNIIDGEELRDFLLYSHASQLKEVKYFLFQDQPVGAQELIVFLKKLPPFVQSLALSNLGLKLDSVDKIIEALPKNLRRLSIFENPFGEEGLKKFREYKRKMEEKTGLPFVLIEVMNLFN